MPSKSLQEAIKEAYASAPTNQIIYETMEFRQTGVQDSVFVVQSRKPLVAYDENRIQRTFQPLAFAFSLPQQTSDGVQNLNLAMDNVGKLALNFLTTAKSSKVPVQVFYRPYLSTNLNEPQMNPPLVLILKNVGITVTQITGQAVFMDLANKRFPLNLYTTSRFPTL